MKRFYCVFTFLLSFYVSAQDLQIINGGPWVLEKIEINQIEYFPGSILAEHIFMGNQAILSHWNCVETFTFDISYTGTSQFILLFEGSTGGTCEVPIDIYQKHFEFYFGNEDQDLNLFTYQFLPVDETQMLIITNNDGDKAFYIHLWLGTNLVTPKNLTLYPNPVKDILQLYGIEIDNIEQVELFDVSGKKIALPIKYDLRNVFINLSYLSGGFYVIKITNKSGEVESRKFLKE